MKYAIATAKLAAFLLITALLVLPHIVVMWVDRNGKAAYTIPCLWHKIVCALFQMDIEVVGTPVNDKQVVYVANHVSYLDIPALSSILKTSFVAKADVAGWPLFGFLAKLQQTAFISRARSDAVEGTDMLTKILSGGKSLVIFPEGTSSNGATVLPFKSALFSIVLSQSNVSPPIQPVTIELVAADEKSRDLYAWYGEMSLVPHLWQFAQTNGAKIRLHFHPLRNAQDSADRKALARVCHDDVLSGLGSGLAKAA